MLLCWIQKRLFFINFIYVYNIVLYASPTPSLQFLWDSPACHLPVSYHSAGVEVVIISSSSVQIVLAMCTWIWAFHCGMSDPLEASSPSKWLFLSSHQCQELLCWGWGGVSVAPSLFMLEFLLAWSCRSFLQITAGPVEWHLPKLVISRSLHFRVLFIWQLSTSYCWHLVHWPDTESLY